MKTSGEYKKQFKSRNKVLYNFPLNSSLYYGTNKDIIERNYEIGYKSTE